MWEKLSKIVSSKNQKGTHMIPSTVNRFALELELKAFIKANFIEKQYLKEALEGMKRIRKPTHGTCCTCQKCGYSNEDSDCECSRNELIDDIKKLIA